MEIKKNQAKRGRVDDDDTDVMDMEIKEMLMSLSGKMDILKDTMAGNDIRLNDKIDKLETAMSSRINDVKDELENSIHTVSVNLDKRLENAMVDAKLKCDWNVSNALQTINQSVNEMRANHESRLDRLERFSLDKDIIISGVPLESNDDPFGILGDICGALNCGLKQGDFTAAFRLKNGSGNAKNRRSVPIVVMMQDDWVKKEILTAYFRKRNLNLTDIGFKTAARVFIKGSLQGIVRSSTELPRRKNPTTFIVFTPDVVWYISNVTKMIVRHALPISVIWKLFSR